MKRIVNGVEIEMTAKEIQQHKEHQKRTTEKIKETEWLVKRKEAYPSITDQLDTIYHKGVNAWKAEIKAVKDAHPKPTQ